MVGDFWAGRVEWIERKTARKRDGFLPKVNKTRTGMVSVPASFVLSFFGRVTQISTTQRHLNFLPIRSHIVPMKWLNARFDDRQNSHYIDDHNVLSLISEAHVVNYVLLMIVRGRQCNNIGSTCSRWGL